MHTWSKMRSKLEKEYLADSLKGHITYFATSFNKAPDHWGRAAILLDGKEVIDGSYCELWSKADKLPKDETLNARLTRVFPFIDETALKYGQFDQMCFYNAFSEFDNQSIDHQQEEQHEKHRLQGLPDKLPGKLCDHDHAGNNRKNNCVAQPPCREENRNQSQQHGTDLGTRIQLVNRRIQRHVSAKCKITHVSSPAEQYNLPALPYPEYQQAHGTPSHSKHPASGSKPAAEYEDSYR